MNIFKLAALGLFCLSLFLIHVGCGGAPVPSNTAANSPSNAPTADTMATGRRLYNQNCAACHRVSGKGGTMEFDGKTIDPEDLTSEKMLRTSDEKLYGYIIEGAPDDGMPAFKDKLKEPEIREIVRYMRASLQKIP